MKQAAKLLGGVLLAVFLLWVVLRGKDPAEIRAAMASASIGGLLIAGVINIGHNVFRVWRWRLLLVPTKQPIPFRSMFSAVILGYLTTWVIPGRLGELVRPALLSTREQIPLGPCIGSVVADRLLDGAAIVGLFALGIFLVPLDPAASADASKLRFSAGVLVIAIFTVLAVLLVAGSKRARLGGWVERRSSNAVRWVGRTVLSFSSGIDALRRPRLVAPILLHSLLAWLTIAFGTWIGVRAAGAMVPFAAILVLLPPLALGVALPTPGGAGGYHAAMSLGLSHLFGVPAATAVGVGILMHLMVTLPVVGIGLVVLKTERLSWGDLTGIVRQVGALGAAAPPPAEATR